MKKSRFSESQMVKILKEAESGIAVEVGGSYGMYFSRHEFSLLPGIINLRPLRPKIFVGRSKHDEFETKEKWIQ